MTADSIDRSSHLLIVSSPAEPSRCAATLPVLLNIPSSAAPLTSEDVLCARSQCPPSVSACMA